MNIQGKLIAASGNINAGIITLVFKNDNKIQTLTIAGSAYASEESLSIKGKAVFGSEVVEGVFLMGLGSKHIGGNGFAITYINGDDYGLSLLTSSKAKAKAFMQAIIG